MSSHSRCLYIGATSELHGGVWEHKNGVLEGFTKKYKINQLVYYEFFHDIESAIAREKQLKGWSRAKKIALIEKMNLNWEDLALPDATEVLRLGSTHRNWKSESTVRPRSG